MGNITDSRFTPHTDPDLNCYEILDKVLAQDLSKTDTAILSETDVAGCIGEVKWDAEKNLERIQKLNHPNFEIVGQLETLIEKAKESPKKRFISRSSQN